MRRVAPLFFVLSIAACGSDGADGDDTADTGADGDAVDDTPADTGADGDDVDGADGCGVTGEAPDFVLDLGCRDDFEALASEPLDASIPAARSLKTVYDRVSDTLYFQNVHRFATHYPFCVAHLSGHGLPPVPDAGTFNAREYYATTRRFLLGTLTHYGAAGTDGVWAYELAPYDTANADMVATAFRAIADHAFFGDALRFHPTSQAIERLVLPADIPIVTTDELFEGIAYQPLNLATAMGRLVFARAADLGTEGGAADTALDYRDIAVLDYAPNDISVVQGIITDQLQTPLSHVNVLSQNRGTPNMALRGAFTDGALRALEGRWVELVVGAFDWSIREVTQAEADAWWESHRPSPLGIPARNLAVTDVRSIDALLADGDATLGEAIDAAIPAFGGKASNYAALRRVPGLRVRKALAIPIARYARHLADNGLDARIDALLADPGLADPATRRARLAELREAIIAAPIDPALLTELAGKLPELSYRRCRYRSSTNAEDLEGFTGAGLYESVSGDPDDPEAPIDVAIKTVWASVWRLKAFDEREYRGVDHTAVGMAILVTPAFTSEEANGVAITGNLFDPEGIEPAFVINVQKGETSVVLPPPGITSDYFIYYYFYPGQPSTYLGHSNLVGAGQTVMTAAQTFALGQALDAIHTYFAPAYQEPDAFYGMDVEFKLDAPPGEAPVVWIKQARPHPGWGLTPPR